MNPYNISLSVPASLLLCGEYTITDTDNHAICIATSPRARLTIQQRTPAQSDEHPVFLKGIFNNTVHIWHNPQQCELWNIAAKIFPHIHESITTTAYNTHIHNIIALSHITVTIDTTAFFTTYTHPHTKVAQPKKLGLGSSEASAVLMCAAHMILAGYDPTAVPTLLAQYAARTHFVWQKNKGSGYGVYTAVFGGIGMYHTTTPYPTWTPLPTLTTIAWGYWTSTHAVSSRNALASFQNWRAHNKEKAYTLCTQMDTYIQQCPYKTHPTNILDTIVQWLTIIRDLGIEMGNAIQVDAIIHPLHPECFRVWKASGAGNEIGIGILTHTSHSDEEMNTVIPIYISKGIQWDYPPNI